MKKDIFIILPYKESLNPNFAGAVSLYVKDTINYSKYKKRIQIISSDDLENKKKLFRNRNYIVNFCKKFEKSLNKIDALIPSFIKFNNPLYACIVPLPFKKASSKHNNDS